MLQAKVAVNVHWDHVSLWALTVASVLMYVGTRLYYLISGKSATLSGGSVNIPFTWMSIVADAALAILGIYLHQNFWKQTVKFTPIPDVEIQEIHRVRPRPTLPSDPHACGPPSVSAIHAVRDLDGVIATPLVLRTWSAGSEVSRLITYVWGVYRA